MIPLLLMSLGLAYAQTEVKYLRNYDGDTITFDIGKVRVLGIDTPEIRSKKPCEKESAIISRDYVEKRMKNATKITITNFKKKDIYGRILAEVQIDGKDLKDELLTGHYGVPYVPKKRQKVNWCKLQEKRHESKKL